MERSLLRRGNPNLRTLVFGFLKNCYIMVKLGKKAIFGIIAAAALAAGAILVLLRPEHVEEILPVVGIDTVRTRNVEIYGEFPGKIRAQQFVEVRARVEGYLEDMMFAEGTYVKKDQVLFIIDPKQYKAQVDRAEALVTKNKAIALKAERDLARIRPLYEQKAASQLDLDNAIAAYESAKADVQVSEANLTEARLALSYTTVRSPISGYISERHVDIGTLVGPGAQSLLANVVKSDTVLVEFKMTDLDYQKSKARNVNLGQKDTSRHWDPFVTITMADKTQYKYKGLVDFADPLVDAKSGTFSVRAEMPNPDRELLPGQFTNVRVLLDVRENAVAVPTKAITIEKSGSFIYVVKADASVEKRFIQTGPEVENATIVERGLNPNEIIVVEGQHKLSHGTKVKAL